MISAKRRVAFVRRSDKSRAIVTEPAIQPEPSPAERVPRISRLMALAIRFDRLIREGKVRDQSELARLAHVTQPRMTQIMNLNLLAPDVQEALLFLNACCPRRLILSERDVRSIVAAADWHEQRMAVRAARKGVRSRGEPRSRVEHGP